MNDSKRQDNAKVALITGAAKRIGAAITRKLHSSGYKVIIHCDESTNDAAKLAGVGKYLLYYLFRVRFEPVEVFSEFGGFLGRFVAMNNHFVAG